MGTAAVMPLGAPIGSNRGMVTRDQIRIIIDQAEVPVVVDGFISTAGALIAYTIEPFVRDYLIFAHRSVEPGHKFMQEALGCKKPLLDLNMRLGEGTGGAVAMNIVDAATAVLTDISTFEEAAVAGADK